MKNSQYFKNLALAMILIFISSCETNESSNNYNALPDAVDQKILKYSTVVAVVDRPGENSVQIQFQSDNELLIQHIQKSVFELIALEIDDPRLENDLDVTTFQSTNQHQAMDHLRLTVLQQNIKPDVIAYSIKQNPESILLEDRKSLRLIQTEFISPFASIGGYVQAYFNTLQSKKTFQVHVENREDLENSPAISILRGTLNDPLLVTGFSDPMGIARLWRVRVIHESGVYPMVFWTGSLSL